MHKGDFTTCNHDKPHFSIRAKKIKVIPGDKIVTGPAYLRIFNLPTPLALPFGFFPNNQKKSSGLIFPSYGESATLGFFLKEGGYYFTLSEKADLALKGDIYSKGSWGLKSIFRYIFSKHDSLLLSKNNEGLSEIYKPGEWLANDDNIEHWAPQNFKNTGSEYFDIWKSIDKDMIHNIGNLIIINSRKNSELGNKAPSEKFKNCSNLSDKTTALFGHFLNEYQDYFINWNEESIRNRSKSLSKISYNKIWKIIHKVH